MKRIKKTIHNGGTWHEKAETILMLGLKLNQQIKNEHETTRKMKAVLFTLCEMGSQSIDHFVF